MALAEMGAPGRDVVAGIVSLWHRVGETAGPADRGRTGFRGAGDARRGGCLFELLSCHAAWPPVPAPTDDERTTRQAGRR